MFLDVRCDVMLDLSYVGSPCYSNACVMYEEKYLSIFVRGEII